MNSCGFMRNITVSQSKAPTVGEMPVEYVERKGLGHPDSLIDGIVERISVKLSDAYMDASGVILHHNVDKGLIVGGAAEVSFGYGKILKPIEVIVVGRAAKEFKGKPIPVDEIAVCAAKAYLKENTRFLDIEKEVVYTPKITHGSADLTKIFSRSTEMPLANDTSFGIGFAPLTDAERLALETEHFLNSKEYKQKAPAVGEDIKVMAVRENENITLTIAIAFVSKFIKNADEYIGYKERVAKDVKSFTSKITGRNVEVMINSGDNRKEGSFYITKTGLSCENGDDGSVGRGNRVNGLITPFRYMSLEAAAGKNPVSHIGKIYNILANEIAKDAVKLYPEIKECTVSIVSQIGRRIDDPKNLDIKLTLENGKELAPIRKKIVDLGDEALDNIQRITKGIIAGEHKMF